MKTPSKDLLGVGCALGEVLALFVEFGVGLELLDLVGAAFFFFGVGVGLDFFGVGEVDGFFRVGEVDGFFRVGEVDGFFRVGEGDGFFRVALSAFLASAPGIKDPIRSSNTLLEIWVTNQIIALGILREFSLISL